MDASCYTYIAELPSSHSSSDSVSDLRSALEKGNDDVKLDTLRRIIVSTINGNVQPQLLMPIIQYVMPSKSKSLKKMLHFYWEVCPKYDEQGKLKQEMILVVNAIRNDLQHPNEYIRGATLRFLQKISKDTELLDPLIPTVRANLEHRHSYVRKNAIFALHAIHKHNPQLIPDAVELLTVFLGAETDSTCKRNAFVFLASCEVAKAVEWVGGQISGSGGAIEAMDEVLQMSVIEVVRLDCRNDPTNRGKYIRTVTTLLSSSSHSVKYEAATTLTTLTTNPAAIRASFSTLLTLVVKSSDTNVKLIVLSRLETLYARYPNILSSGSSTATTSGGSSAGLVMDVLQILSSSSGDMEVRRKAIGLVLSMTTSRSVEDVVRFLGGRLEKTVTSTDAEDTDKAPEYRQLLIQSIHVIAIKYAEVASSVILSLMDFLGEGYTLAAAASSSNSPALDVLAFIREAIQKYPALRSLILDKLFSTTLPLIRSGKVYRGVLWIIGEYTGADTTSRASAKSPAEEIEAAMSSIRSVIGDIPIVIEGAAPPAEADPTSTENGAAEPNSTKSSSKESKQTSRPKVLADGTYATETAFTPSSSAVTTETAKEKGKWPLRALIVAGDFFTASVLSGALTKLALRYSKVTGETTPAVNALKAECMLIMTSLIRVGLSPSATVGIDEDSNERIMNCIQTLSEFKANATFEEEVEEIFLFDTKKAFEKMLNAQEKRAVEKKALQAQAEGKGTTKVTTQVDDLISFRQFSKKGLDDGTDELEDLSLATGTVTDAGEDFISNLSRISQLTGFSDPIYAEAYVKMQGFDVLLDVLLVNQTANTLQNLCLDFATLGDLKIVEKPSVYTIPPHGFQSVKATVKVSSTETGVIFGSILWEGPNLSETCVILNDIHIDIMDYIKPAYCNEAQFRSMWTEFEWENRVNVNSPLSDPRDYLKHVMKATNMSCLTPDGALSGDCGFLSANMYARSLFGEDALANLSIERTENGAITGHVRIRSKTQGIALSLGDRITMAQKDSKPVTL